jgi:zinc protease
VVSNYFGWSFNSRLNEEIRVKRGLTYGARGGYYAQAMAGEFKAGTFTKTESTAVTVETMLAEIEKLKEKPPTDKELSESRNYIIGSFLVNRETPQQVAEDLWLIESQGLSDDYLQNLVDSVAGTDEDKCLRLVEETIDAGKMVVVVLGDAEKIKDELAQIAPVTVVSQEQEKSLAAAE